MKNLNETTPRCTRASNVHLLYPHCVAIVGPLCILYCQMLSWPLGFKPNNLITDTNGWNYFPSEGVCAHLSHKVRSSDLFKELRVGLLLPSCANKSFEVFLHLIRISLKRYSSQLGTLSPQCTSHNRFEGTLQKLITVPKATQRSTHFFCMFGLQVLRTTYTQIAQEGCLVSIDGKGPVSPVYTQVWPQDPSMRT